jgi:hypothetical protein
LKLLQDLIWRPIVIFFTFGGKRVEGVGARGSFGTKKCSPNLIRSSSEGKLFDKALQVLPHGAHGAQPMKNVEN